jgi:hypothetical protein
MPGGAEAVNEGGLSGVELIKNQLLYQRARRTALMKEFGTKPAEAFEKDIISPT